MTNLPHTQLPKINSVYLRSIPGSELLRIPPQIVFNWPSARAICQHFCEHGSSECQFSACFTFQLLNISLHLIFYLWMGRLFLYYSLLPCCSGGMCILLPFLHLRLHLLLPVATYTTLTNVLDLV